MSEVQLNDSHNNTGENEVSHIPDVVSRWVSVKDRLPELMQLCLVVYQKTHNNRWYAISCYCGKRTGFDIDNVTHWMPLPEKPNV